MCAGHALAVPGGGADDDDDDDEGSSSRAVAASARKTPRDPVASLTSVQE